MMAPVAAGAVSGHLRLLEGLDSAVRCQASRAGRPVGLEKGVRKLRRHAGHPAHKALHRRHHSEHHAVAPVLVGSQVFEWSKDPLHGFS